MKRFVVLLSAVALAACATVPVDPPALTTADYAAALSAAGRPAADVERDPVRKPAELFAFAGIRPGDSVGDWFIGGGYLTRALAAVVGPAGHVYAFQPEEMIARRAQYGTDQDAVAAAYANVDAVRGPIAAAPFPAGLDAVITVQNFHDMYHPPLPPDTAAKAMAAIYAALKPGGTLTIVDHSAIPGSGTRDSDKLHRIDPQIVSQVVAAAGFRPDGDSALFANPDDPRTASVFDPSIRGRTEQFLLRFRKPG